MMVQTEERRLVSTLEGMQVELLAQYYYSPSTLGPIASRYVHPPYLVAHDMDGQAHPPPSNDGPTTAPTLRASWYVLGR